MVGEGRCACWKKVWQSACERNRDFVISKILSWVAVAKMSQSMAVCSEIAGV